MDGLVKKCIVIVIIVFSLIQGGQSYFNSLPRSNATMSCENFDENQPIYIKQGNGYREIPETCVRRNPNQPDTDFQCYHTLKSEECGPGFRMIPLNKTTCLGQENGLVRCCTPCARCVIQADNKDCNDECCRWDRLKPGQQYTKQVGEDLCTYSVGCWGDCDKDILKRFRNDTLYSLVSHLSCPTVHKMSKICVSEELNPTTSPVQERTIQTITDDGKEDRKALLEMLRGMGCRYDDADISECLPNNTLKVLRRKAKGPEECPEVLEDYKSCCTSKGEARCFYGKWSRWTPCEGHVQLRERKVLTPDAPHCDKTLKARICSSSSSSLHRRRRRKYQQSPNS